MFKNRTVIIFSSVVFIACILIIYLLVILGTFDRSPEIREESSVSLLDRICLYGDDKELFRWKRFVWVRMVMKSLRPIIQLYTYFIVLCMLWSVHLMLNHEDCKTVKYIITSL
ncbi:uncharacterized protein LOC111691406 [Anoplophora glabripennis]|uniref:uncharacterized protein LOC111691406 n=1 Tax=Anoplophora glabripennis TaxID=217634 RepID=UPI000C75CA8F|nr:uncharacterized protein LOC111691406 [Anoplophora glabripennis]